MSFRSFTLLFLALLLGSARAQPSSELDGEKRLAKIMAAGNGENAQEALKEIRAYIEELRAAPLDPKHPAIAYAQVCAGVIASTAGEHEVAIAYLREGLPIFSEKARPGFLLYDEFGFTVALASSLLEVKDSEGSLAVLEDLRRRVKAQLEWVGTGILSGRKGFEDNGKERSISPYYASEEWLLGLLNKIGEIRLEREEWPEAEQVLKEAGEILERLHPEKKSELAELRENWERAAREQGKAIRPRYVGRFSSPRSIVFEGVESIPVEEIRSALLRYSTFVLASHPAGEFEGYLGVVKKCLELGYRSAGFPDVSVTVEWNEESDSVVARIEEGIGYKAGQVHIDGVDSTTRESLLDRIVIRDESEGPPATSRGDYIFQEIQKQKKIPAEKVETVLMETFPELAAEKKSKREQKGITSGSSANDRFQSLNPLQEDDDDEALPPFWEKGKSVDYRTGLGNVRGRLREAYAEEGTPFAKFEVDWDLHPETGIADLQVKILSEGPVTEFGETHVVGNRINSREEILAFLDIESGKEARGNLKGQIGRKLYESGRFLAWEVESFRKDPKSNRIDLLIIVEEHWEAPPLSAPLSRAQETMLRFGRWLNEEAGLSEDICIEFYGSSGDIGEFELSMTLRDAAACFSFYRSDLDHGIAGAFEGDENTEILIIGEEKTASFRASVPNLKNPVTVFFWIIENFPSSPEGPTGNVNFGAVARRSSESGRVAAKKDYSVFGIDPASVLKQCGAWEGNLFYFEDGFLVRRGEGFELKIEEETGKLESIKSSSEFHYLEVSLAEDLLDEGLAEIRKLAKTAPDWGEGKDPYSLGFLAAGFLAEVANDFPEEESEETPDEYVSRIGSRTLEKWSSLAALSGDVVGSFLNSEAASTSDDPFKIPFDPREFERRYQAGGNLMLFLGLGGYDYLAMHTEPGTWPDLVLRESLFLIDGKPLYLNATIDTLLEDENMGPLGCLVCCGLLQKIGHDSAARFVQKAKEQLTAEGFAGDWSLLLKGNDEEEGMGGMILKLLKGLDDAQIDEFLASSSDEAREAVKDLLLKARAIEGEPDVESLAPIMNSLWESLLREPITQLVVEVEKSLTPDVDPAVFAAFVNSVPVPRGAVRLKEKGQESWFGYTPLEESIVTLLMAQEVWSRGQSATPEAIEKKSSGIISSLENGWEDIEAMGFSRKLFDWWIGVQLAADAQAGLWGRTKEASEEEARSFHERHPDQFGVSRERNVQLIALKKFGDGKEQREMLNRILKEVREAGDMEEKKRLFGEAVVSTQSRIKLKQEGDERFIKPEKEFFPGLARAIDVVPDGETSEVFEANDHLFLILIPEASRTGKPQPFEEVAQILRGRAMLEREQQILRKRAHVTLYEEPVEGGTSIAETGESEPPSEASYFEKLDSFGDRLLGSVLGESTDTSSEEEEEVDPRSLLEIAVEDSPKGDPYALFLLGSFAERNLGPEPGLAAAVANYRKSAEGGDLRAMLRLSELYRIGQGVKKDEKKSEEWRDKAYSGILNDEVEEPSKSPAESASDGE